jgi:hypothetical protein
MTGSQMTYASWGLGSSYIAQRVQCKPVEPVKVMFQLSGCNKYGVDQFLNMSVPSFGLIEHLTDELD